MSYRDWMAMGRGASHQLAHFPGCIMCTTAVDALCQGGSAPSCDELRTPWIPTQLRVDCNTIRGELLHNQRRMAT